jgi:hypothetical protein
MDTRWSQKEWKKADRWRLIHESKVYNHLRSIQGSCIPVSPGIVDLELPYYYEAGVYVSMLSAGLVDLFAVPYPDK